MDDVLLIRQVWGYSESDHLDISALIFADFFFFLGHPCLIVSVIFKRWNSYLTIAVLSKLEFSVKSNSVFRYVCLQDDGNNYFAFLFTFFLKESLPF